MSQTVPPPKLKVFLCHSSGDKPQVRELYKRLQAEKWLQPWLDEEDLIPGQEWREEIEKEVEQSHIILLCLSPDSITKEGYVEREIRVALDQADCMPEGTIYIIQLKLKPCELPRRLNKWHRVNYFEERGHEILLRGLRARAEKSGIKLDLPQADSNSISPAQPPDSVVQTQERSVTPSPPPARPPQPVVTEQDRLLRELENLDTTHQRRQEIGDHLARIGDTRPGVGVRPDGVPDIEWLPVAPGGLVEIEGKTFPVEPFYIARYQVTYAQYDAFVKAPDGYQNRKWWVGFPHHYQPQKLDDQRTPSLNNPRDNLSWYQSVAFTRWLNYRLTGLKLALPGGPNLIAGQNAEIRLPSEGEWQWAAQNGPEKREYPWGKWQESYANTYGAKLGRAVAVGMYPQGAAGCGALDMSGNLWEWCLNKYSQPTNIKVDNSDNLRGMRGVSFNGRANFAACAYRSHRYPLADHGPFGVRVVASFNPRL